MWGREDTSYIVQMKMVGRYQEAVFIVEDRYNIFYKCKNKILSQQNEIDSSHTF